MKKIVTIRIIEIDTHEIKTLETNYVLLNDDLTDDDVSQLYDDCNLHFDDLLRINDITDKRVLNDLAHFIERVTKQKLKKFIEENKSSKR